MATDQVFISYAKEDLETIRQLCHGLNSRGVTLWFDKENLRPGKWLPQIRKAINSSKYFFFCLSEAALHKIGDEPGFLDNELNVALNIAMALEDEAFTIVPVRLEDCGRGDHRLSIYQQFDLFEDWDDTLDKLSMFFGGHPAVQELPIVEHIEEKQKAVVLHGKAASYFYRGDYTKAIGYLQRALELRPNNIYFLHSIGTAYVYAGESGQALSYLKRALELQPDNPQILYVLGLALTYNGDIDEALPFLKRFAEARPDDAYLQYTLGLAFFLNGQSAEAIDSLERSFKLRPYDPVCLNVLGDVLMDNGQNREAVSVLQKARRLAPENLSIIAALGLALLCAERNTEAERVLHSILKSTHGRDDIESQLVRGVAMLQLGRTAESLLHLKNYLQLEPTKFQLLGAVSYLRIAARLGISGAHEAISLLEEGFTGA